MSRNNRKPRYHGGPVSKLALSEGSARRRGLKQSGDTPKLNPVKVIVRDGVIVNPRAFKKLIGVHGPECRCVFCESWRLPQNLRPKFPAASLVAAGERLGQAGEPAKTNPQSAVRNMQGMEHDNR